MRENNYFMGGVIELLGKIGLGGLLSGIVTPIVKHLLDRKDKKRKFYEETLKIVNRCVDDTYEMCSKIEYVPKDKALYSDHMIKRYNNFVSSFNDLSGLIKDNSAFHYSIDEEKYLMAIVESCKFIGYVFAEENVFNDPEDQVVDHKEWYKVSDEQNSIKENRKKLQECIERRFKKRSLWSRIFKH